jgi:MoaA/NifB/PqqE/SkfB family radical SAM enzyme
MDKIFTPIHFTWLANRKCSFNCPSCNLTKNCEDDLPQNILYSVMDKVKEKFPSIVFWCVLGGDVLDLPKPVEFVKELSDRKVFYAITSHSKFPYKSMPEDMMKAGLTNWSVSIDQESRPKTKYGFKAIDIFKELGQKDIHATLTIDRTNINNILELIEKLDSLDVWSEVTPYIWSKSDMYDFGADINLRPDEKEISSLLDKLILLNKNKRFKFHNIVEYYEWWKNDYDFDWKCKYPWGLVIDNDGHYRMCLHCKGKYINKYSIFDNVSNEALYYEWKKDQDEFCLGCGWNCQIESEFVYSKTKSLETVKNYFKHGGLNDL